jgi:hypothetical protein
MPSRKKTIQTTLKTNNIDDAWKTIGRAKRNATSTAPSLDPDNKKTDTKLTPPRPSEHLKTTQNRQQQ